MASVVDICNLALSRVGVTEFIADLEEDTTEAIACNAVYEVCRDMALASFPWPFAKRRVALSEVTPTTEREDFAYVYALPPDAVSVQHIWSGIRVPMEGTRIPFTVEMNEGGNGKWLMTDHEAATLVYTAKVENTGLFPPLFVNALAWLVASEIAMPLAKRTDLRDQAYARYEMMIAKAQASVLGESHETMPESEIITVRGG